MSNPYPHITGNTITLTVPQGWQCPCCQRVYSPTTAMCLYCRPEKMQTQTTTGTPLPVMPTTTCGDKDA